MSQNAAQVTFDQLRSAETTMGRMLNVLEGMQQEREAATQLSASIGVMSRLMGEMLAEREELIDEVVSCREAVRQRDALVVHGREMVSQVTELREVNRELTERLRDTLQSLDAAEHHRRQAEARLQDGQDRLLTSPAPQTPPLVSFPPDGAPLKDIEFEALVQALTAARLLRRRAAALLGISERAMNYKCGHVFRDRLEQRGIRWRNGRADGARNARRQATTDESIGSESLRPIVAPPGP